MMDLVKVLVVDDQKDVADSLASILTLNGYAASAVYNGTEAVKLARMMRPHLLLADVLMPDLDGVETAKRIRRFLPRCKVLLISGSLKSSQMWENARRHGFDFDFVMKPVAPEELLNKLQSYR